ncbi:MAG TPA: hypothetical protein VKA68_16590, partial [bacterium]|nr:hypothetical protein [bacterium]
FLVIAAIIGCQNPLESPLGENSPAETAPEQQDGTASLRLLQANYEGIQLSDVLGKSEGFRRLRRYGGIVWQESGGIIGKAQSAEATDLLEQNSGSEWWIPVLSDVRGNAVIFPPNALDENVFIEMVVGVNSDDVIFHSIVDRATIEVDGSLPGEAKSLLSSLVESLLGHVDLEGETTLGFAYTPGARTAAVEGDEDQLRWNEKSLVWKIAKALTDQNEPVEVVIRINPDVDVQIEGGPVDAYTKRLVRDLVDSFERRVADRIEVRLEYEPGSISGSVEVVQGNVLPSESDLLEKIIKRLWKSRTKVAMTIAVEGEDYHFNLNEGYEAVLVTPSYWLKGSPNVAVNYDDHSDYQSVVQYDRFWYFRSPHFSRWVWGILD